MDTKAKEQIVEQLKNFVAKKGSLNKAAAELGKSSATISNMLAGKWAKMSDEMFRSVQTLIATPEVKGWQHAETAPFKAYSFFFNDAKFYSNAHAIISQPGSGKTYALEYFKSNYKNVFYVKCRHFTTPKDFLTDLAKSIGIGNPGYRLSDLFRQITKALSQLESPLILIDEIEKTDGHKIFMLFIDLYNELFRKAGIVLLGTPGLKRRIEYALDRKVGYNEVLSRVGGNIIEVAAPTVKDAVMIAQINGVTKADDAYTIANESETDAGTYDLRRVEKLIHSHKLGEVA